MTTILLCLIIAASCFAWVAWDRRAHRFEVEMLNDVYRAAEEAAEHLREKLQAANVKATQQTERADLAVAQAVYQRDERYEAEERVQDLGTRRLMLYVESRILPSLTDPADLLWGGDEPAPIYDALRRASVSFVVLPAPTLAEAVAK